ncbi:hypothetical protein BKA65DRAFT_501932 [Rhexocercosporidium sp. MPI-PUGE-AT-0058]|nr:hypothetical protein BKA65DRAFT_501932 [Rhexocercosporidium sp. MPI-PUGE-AT-0058]
MGLIAKTQRNPMAIRVVLEPSSSTFIRSLIDKYRQPEYCRAKPRPASTWSHLMLLRLPPIDPSICSQATSKISRLYNPFDVVFSRPYRASVSRGDYVALEYWSYEASEVMKHLQEDLFSEAQEYADSVTCHLGDKKARTKRRDIMAGLDDGTPHVTLASKLSEQESEKILNDLKKNFSDYVNTPSFTVRAVALELMELSDSKDLPRYLEPENFPFEVQQSAELGPQME